MSENGEEKLIAVARHIAKTLGHTDTMTDDILKIFSSFDNRLREKLTQNLSYDTVEQTLDSLHRQISPFLHDRPIWSNPDGVDPEAFLASVDQLISAVQEWTPLADDKHMSSFLDRADDLLQQCVFRLQDEFRTLVLRGSNVYSFDRSTVAGGGTAAYSDEEEDYDLCDDVLDGGVDSIPVANPLTDYDVIIDALPRGVISDLHAIAKRMVAAGYGKECCHVYSACRREFLEESFARLGLQHKLSIDEVHKMQWTELEDEINKWIKAINVALRILYPSERRLCDRVFLGFSSVSDLSFMEVCRGTVIQLLNFADAVAIGSRAPERLFRVLDVYETIRDLMPEFEMNFSDQYCVQLRNESVTILKRLGEGIRGIFMELENLIRRDPAKVAAPGGGLHPITRYVMNYLRAACRSRQTLEQVFEDGVGIASYRDENDRSGSSLAVQMEWIMELLESNLDLKSKVYKDPALCSVFMVNNARYILQKVKDSELGALLGEDWIKKNTAKARQYHVNYQRSSWSKVLGALKVDDHGSSPNGGGSRVLREKIKSFNSYFEETCKNQTSWIVFDEQLRDELRASVLGSLCPAYRNFILRLQGMPEIARHMDRYVKYSVEDVEARVRELFQGNSGGRR